MLIYLAKVNEITKKTHRGSRAQGHGGTRAQGHGGTRAQGHEGTRAQGHGGTGAQGHKGAVCRSFFNLSSFFLFLSFAFRLSPFALLFLLGCAQQGSLTGGAKDEKPPVLVKSEPGNFSTHFTAKKVTLTFDEYFELRGIGQKLVVSPPMDKKPEFKLKGKELEIVFKDSLQPNRTYALNFGDALVDLNEANPLKNFQYVFSTGSEIDSLEASGKVVLAFDGKPAEDVLVMLYAGTSDSMPIKEIPIYISRTDKEGKFTLRNMAAGSYKIFALKDANSNMLFDQPTEAVAFLDSLVVPSVAAPEPAKVDSLAVPDSLHVADSLLVADQIKVADSLKIADRQIVADTVARADTVKRSGKMNAADSISSKPKTRYLPDNLELRLFTEARPNQYISGTDRVRPEQIRFRLNEKVDSLGIEFLDLPEDSMPVKLDWYDAVDTLDIWITNPAVAARDSIVAFLTYRAYDSLEQPFAKTDTVKFRYRPPVKAANTPKKDFTFSATPEKSKTLDPGQRLILTFTLPFSETDTSKIRLTTGKDSLARAIEYRLVPDTLKGLVLNGIPVVQDHPRIVTIQAPLLPDSSYRLAIKKGAFTGISGQLSDSLDISFKIRKPEDFGSVRIKLPALREPAILELLGGQNKVVSSQRLAQSGEVFFGMLPAGKYSLRLIFDTNSNGVWDTGRYLRHLQPERVIIFTKELNVKANWEVTETWEW